MLGILPDLVLLKGHTTILKSKHCNL